jgi:Peptidase A4 family
MGVTRWLQGSGPRAVLLGFALLLAALLVGARTAHGSRTSAADTPQVSVTPNQSGYVASAPAGTTLTFSSATGTWNVPPATCGSGSAGGFSTVWVGLGDEGPTPSQEEVGTDSNCDSNGNPIYYAWFELVPYIAYDVPSNDKIAVNDTMVGLVKILSTTLVEVSIQDQTRHWNFTRNITFSNYDAATADWIVEAPASCLRWVCSEANLANFGSVTMRNISATTKDGQTGTLSDPDWLVTPLQLVPSKLLVPNLGPSGLNPQDNPQGTNPTDTGKATSPAGATSGAYSSDGTSFATTWVANAKPAV